MLPLWIECQTIAHSSGMIMLLLHIYAVVYFLSFFFSIFISFFKTVSRHAYKMPTESDGRVVREELLRQSYQLSGSGRAPEMDPLDTVATKSYCRFKNFLAPPSVFIFLSLFFSHLPVQWSDANVSIRHNRMSIVWNRRWRWKRPVKCRILWW